MRMEKVAEKEDETLNKEKMKEIWEMFLCPPAEE